MHWRSSQGRRAAGERLLAITGHVAGEGFDAIGVGDADGGGHDDFILSSAWAVVQEGRQGRVFLVAGPQLR